ncbi:MAG: helix-turn-helix domain-containing protein [Symploca sp. SIO2G7]|nr:helix-turn-helix domain-containing protein [Symploca sp. SIO2G7]
MNKTLIKWKLAELMAKHRVTGRELSKVIGRTESAITKLKGAKELPRLSGNDLEKLLLGIERLADEDTLTRPLTITDLVEWEREVA